MSITAFSAGLMAALLAGLALVVALLYFLKPPPRRLTVSSNLIWDRVLKLKRTDNERWRWWLSLLLSLLIAAAMALALGRPELTAQSGEQRHVAIVIDNAPTMAARTSNGETRLARAKREARALIDGNPAGTRFLIADTTRTVGSPAYLSAREAITLLESLNVTAGAVPRYPRLDASTVRPHKREEVFYTDGVVGIEAPASVQVESMFEPAINVGITAFDVRTLTADPRKAEAFLEIGNASAAAVEATVIVAGAGRAPIEKVLNVPGRGFASHSFALDQFSGGALRATVRTPNDALEIDNSAFAFLPFNRSLRVALVSATGDRALERALRLDPRIVLSVISPKQYAARGGFDGFVFDRFTPPVMPAAPALLFHPNRAAWLPSSEATLAQPAIESWLPEHPALENVSFRDVQIQRSGVFSPKTDSHITLVRASGGKPLIVASETSPRWLGLGFAVSESNFAEQPSFPMFVSNALAWLTAEEMPLSKPIGTIVIPFERAKVTALEGDTPSPRFVPRSTLVSSEAPNLYTAESDGRRLRILVNVLDPAITDINASTLQPAAVETIAASNLSVARVWQPWVILLLAAFAFMVFEWLTYHRRATV